MNLQKMEIDPFIIDKDTVRQPDSGQRKSSVKFNKPRKRVKRIPGPLIAQISICVFACALMLSMRSLEIPGSEQMVLSVQNILNKEMDFDEMLGKLQFVELPNVLEVFAADKKMAVPVNADNVKIAHDEGYIEWEESPDAQVIAAANGRVRAIGVDDLLGNYIRLEHDGELETIYYGLNSIQVEEGQPIRKLDSLGTLGSGGFLRLYVLYAGKPQPPENYFELKLNK